VIYHVADGGAIRTDPRDPTILVCQLNDVTWTDKGKMWEGCTPDTDVENTALEHPEKARIQAKEPLKEPGEPIPLPVKP
jgi:hypothetical protein